MAERLQRDNRTLKTPAGAVGLACARVGRHRARRVKDDEGDSVALRRYIEFQGGSSRCRRVDNMKRRG